MKPRRPILPLTAAEEARFWDSFHQRPDGCWIWIGELSGDGYGVFRRGKNRKNYAHRVAWCLHEKREVPDELDVLHRCDVRACVKFSDFFLGTQGDNNRDRARKGRTRMGRGNARVTAEIAATIRQRYAAGGVTQKALAAEYGLSNQAGSMIVRGETWKAAS